MAKRQPWSELGGLADPARFTAPLQVAKADGARLCGLLRTMLVIRHTEDQIGRLVVEGLARTPCHLGIGQEAVAVGVATRLRATDRVFGNHRSHSHFLALGGTPASLIAEVLGKATGASRGMGGSMHLFGREFGFHGSVPIVGATIPIAVGAGLAAKLDGGDSVAVAFFGDGATEEGVFHESMNLAVVQGLPVLFVCENNLFSSHLDIDLRQPSDRIGRYAEAHRMRSLTVDGNDLLAVESATTALVDAARRGEGPALLEAVTYRFRGHVGPNEDIDVGVHRRMEDVEAWRHRCPIRRLQDGLVAAGVLSADDLASMEKDVLAGIAEAVANARRAAYPDPSALHQLVYAGQR
ncbi:MAG: thiamine pyrophosphate-dependent dehydrogenase E1 component subunit alpha [Gammaproteobacteria bacterium]|nr:thiamine pyrophosphate-dependent dehydrogenase E1 component subunit alpha [Gammaproteobacteria bacterium]QOJ32633.1 MAG: thiamine pyrophosphate-dependent dehydrogenase E1 component subunit alpha [Gammaproteobacteria bacterium]